MVRHIKFEVNLKSSTPVADDKEEMTTKKLDSSQNISYRQAIVKMGLKMLQL